MTKRRMITYAGETMCLSDWAKKLGIKRSTLSNRLLRGMPITLAMRRKLR